MLRTLRLVRACTGVAMNGLRSFATGKKGKDGEKVDQPPDFLNDKLVKAAIGKDDEVASSFVSAFAPLVHRRPVIVKGVKRLPDVTAVSVGFDMEHDIALHYEVDNGTAATLEVVPNRMLTEVQQQHQRYLPARTLAHASGHYLAAITDKANAIKAERARKKEAAKQAAAAAKAAGQAPVKRPRKERSDGLKSEFSSSVYTAYINVEPVHLLMLADFCYGYSGKWQATKPSTSGGKHSWMAPLFSTFRLSSDAGNLPLVAGERDPGPTGYAQDLFQRMSITMVHLPLVPEDVRDKDAWHKVVTLEEHRVALEKPELREWLHFLAHSKVQGNTVHVATGLEEHRIFRQSAGRAEALLESKGFSFSPKELKATVKEAVEEAVDEAVVAERANAARAMEEERAKAARAMEEAVAAERAKAARAMEEAVAAERAERARLRAKLERITEGEGSRGSA